jgi:hypothetical protein
VDDYGVIVFRDKVAAMTDKVFCYHCRNYHPSTEVRQVENKGVKRWRCLKSIASTKASRAQRDAFGKAVSEANRKVVLEKNRQTLPRSVLEVFRTTSGMLGRPG